MTSNSMNPYAPLPPIQVGYITTPPAQLDTTNGQFGKTSGNDETTLISNSHSDESHLLLVKDISHDQLSGQHRLSRPASGEIKYNY